MQRSRFPTSPRRSPVARIAPTGAAANCIHGYTDHAYFGLPVQSFETLSPLGPDGVSALRRRLEGVSYLIVDEKSMISLVKLAWVDQRLREAYPESNDYPFAGFSITVAGDFYQLPPVSGMALFEARPHTTMAIADKNTYDALSVTIRFVTLVRQSDTDASSIAFRRVLENMRQGNPDLTDFRTLEPRLLSMLERRERLLLRNRPSISLLRGTASNEMNYSRLRDANVPVLLLRARHRHPRYASISSTNFNYLTAELLLSIGARVMLTTNIWTEAGLVTGSRGYVVDIVRHADVTDLRTTLPAYILIYFPKYTGPALPYDIPGVPKPSKVVPIFPCRRYRTQNTTRTSTDNQWREQFPLMVSYGMTIHKSRGMTLDLAIVDLKARGTPRPLGLLYVALSRVWRLEHLTIFADITLDDTRPNVNRALEVRRLDEANRAPQVLLPPLGPP
ncbi:uncharacterized protein CPUR_02995 [Claviceps purpurea 20.1]|uniref:ATP-dependent DNA helicase n=1 Tax=Claviceps purpurea (strain 20.1) TaxID=1111077 RepID=M1VVC9_CLAP2|nr:uncharacterized protein CPUR_02995 [Claviceps purpurea 20.1]